MRWDVQRWFDRRTWREIPEAADLVGRKAGATVSVVLPALNEAATIGPIVHAVATELVGRVPLVDELLVIDSGSDDDTAAVAAEAGADVVRAADVLPELGNATGKGEALWKGVAASSGDLVVFLDADLRDFDARWVSGLVAPLLAEPEVQLVKAAYDRTLLGPDGVLQPTGPASPDWRSHSPGSTPGVGRCSSDCRSSRGTAWSWPCCWTRSRWLAWMPLPRWISVAGCTATDRRPISGGWLQRCS
jgi:glycosyltransferase involved in cell wall biosynthesis